MMSQDKQKNRIQLLKLIKQELQKSKVFVDVDNPQNDSINYFIWTGTNDGIIGNSICHYEFIIYPKKRNFLSVEIHFEDRRFLPLFEKLKHDEEFVFTDWDNGKHKRIIFKNNLIDLNNSEIDNSEIVETAINNLSYIHEKFSEQLKTLLQDNRVKDFVKRQYLIKPKLSLQSGSIVKRKYYKAISNREAKCLDTIHGAIQNLVYNDKNNEKIYETIEKEKPFIGLPYRIDLLAKLKSEDKYDVFEVKTADSAEICIKEALGQILFYKYLLQKGEYKINQLIIVGPSEMTNSEQDFFNSLKKSFPELKYRSVSL